MINYKIQTSPSVNINKVNDILNESINYIKKEHLFVMTIK